MRATFMAAGKTYWPYGLLALIILLPLLKPGYILVVDMVFVPHMPFPSGASHDYLFFALLAALTKILPAMLVQKFLLLGIFLTAGIGAHRLTAALRPPQFAAKDWRWAMYFAGLFYMCNPFVYTRLMAGQYLVFFGYALLPFFARLAWRFLAEPTWRNAAWLTGISTLLSIVSLHMCGAALVLFVLLLIGHGWTHRSQRSWWLAVGKYGALAAIAIVVVSSYWLAPLAQGEGRTAATIAGFSDGDFTAFRTQPGELGLVGNVLALQGFWGDEQNLYLLPQDDYRWWLAPIVALWLLVAAGMIWSWRRQRFAASIFSGLLLIGLVLSIGTAGSFAVPLNRLLVDHLPLYGGYREPQKFAALIVLAYLYFGAVGLVWLRSRFKNHTHRRLMLGVLLLPILCTPLLPWGGAGQLHAADYPKDWYELNDQLKRSGEAKALFLPWHLYMPYSFGNSAVASPAPKFFDIPVIASNNPEIGSATGYVSDTTTQRVDKLIRDQNDDSHLAAKLSALGITHIIVAKEYDYQTYGYLDQTPGLQVYSNTATLKVYHIISGERP